MLEVATQSEGNDATRVDGFGERRVGRWLAGGMCHDCSVAIHLALDVV
jgi:hypothetical protein